MKQLIFYYWRVTSLKESPENTPYSYALLAIASVLLALILTLQWHMISVPADYVMELVIALSLVCSFIGYTAFVLWSRGFSCRIVQTVTSLLMAHSFIHFLATPLLLFEPYLMQEHVNLKNPLFLLIAVVYLFITLGLFIWQFVVTAHIYKFALSTTPIHSVVAALGLLAVNVLTLSLWR